MPVDLATYTDEYRRIGSKIRAAGIPCLLTSGQACISFGFAKHSKDSDWIASPDHADDLLQFLNVLPFETGIVTYASKYGAPLHERWLKGGWSSHLFVPDENGQIGMRFDFFGAPPRVDSSKIIADPNDDGIAHASIVADMKKTGRDKDWPFVGKLADLLFTRKDDSFALHLQSPESIEKARGFSLVTEEMLVARPVLRLPPQDLPRALAIERQMYVETDRLRLATYAQAWTAYGEVLQGLPSSTWKLPLVEQHSILVGHAERLLPAQPIPPAKRIDLTLSAKEKVRNLFGAFDEKILPSHENFYSY